LAVITELKESIARHERQLQSLTHRISGADLNLRKAQTDLKALKSGSPAQVSTASPLPPVSHPKALNEVVFPLTEPRSKKGIISYLTRKHGGNVHDKGIVTITSKSVYPDCPVRNVADLTNDDTLFRSQDEPGQWICWDFHELRVWPTHYTIRSGTLKSWVIESSLDFMNWTEIDRKTDNTDLKAGLFDSSRIASFAISNSAECRFIRLTQTGRSHTNYTILTIRTFEIFGTLLE
jgi:hypothetical protein